MRGRREARPRLERRGRGRHRAPLTQLDDEPASTRAGTETARTAPMQAAQAAPMPSVMIARSPAEHARAVPRDHAICVASDGGGVRHAVRQDARGRRAGSPETPPPSLLAPSSTCGRFGAACARRFPRRRRSAGDRSRRRSISRLCARRHRAVPHFERRHQRHQSQVRLERHLAAIEVQQVIQREEHVGFAQAGDDLEDVAVEAAACRGAAPPSCRRRPDARRCRHPGSLHDTSSPARMSSASGKRSRSSRQPSMES